MQAPEWWWREDGRAGLAWPVLRAAETCYRKAIHRRNVSFDRRQAAGRLYRPSVPTISLGNLTVGGSGKTPLAIWLAQAMLARGVRPGIVARGYGAGAGGLNDEMQLAARKCPGAAIMANPDRAAAIEEVIGLRDAEVVILDDAFQHRQVRRDLDIVLIDATRGLGNGHLLPAGPLREPPESLARADLVLLTRVRQAGPEQVVRLEERVRSAAGGQAAIGRVSFEPAELRDVDLRPAEGVAGPAGLFAGIGNFGSFVATCRQKGIDVAGQMSLSDHCRYDAALCERIERWAREEGFAWLVTTEKDAVKVSEIGRSWTVPVRVLSARVEMDEPTQAVVDAAMTRVLLGRHRQEQRVGG